MAFPRQSLSATGTVTLGMPSATKSGEWVVHFSGTWVGTVQPKAYVPGQGLALADRQNVAYTVLKTGTLTDGSTTGITANGIYSIRVPAGTIVVLECTAFTSGTIVIDAFPSPLA